MKRKIILLLIALVTSLAFTGIVAAQEETPTRATATTIMNVVETDERLTTFKTLVEAAALADNLNEDGPFTVFAPTDEAFAAFSQESGMNLTNILLYHVVNGNYNAAAVAGRSNLPTLSGERLYFNNVDETLSINQIATISVADIRTSNGIIHIIDRVLLPSAVQVGNAGVTIMEVLAEDGRFETLINLLTAAGLDDTLNNTNDTFTLFAPTDEAFAAAPDFLVEKWTADPEGELNTILSYHIVGDPLYSDQIANDDYIPTWEGRPLIVTFDEQDGLLLNHQSLATADMLASNGIIHAVSEVLVP
jgi:transforming growth factor-beta-induced protein